MFSSSKDKFQYGSITVEILHGDITKESTDCIINSSNETLDLNYGATSKALVAQAGPLFVKACQNRGNVMKSNGLVLTIPGNLKCKYVLHIVAPNSELGWFQIIKKCLELAVTNGFTSLSFPALGTGDYLNGSPDAMANLFAETIKKFGYSTTSSSLKLIRIVIFENHMVPSFISAFAGEERLLVGIQDYSTLKHNKQFVKSSLMELEPPLIKGEKEAMAGNKVIYFPLTEKRFFIDSAEEFHYRTAESQFYRKIGWMAKVYRIGKVEYVVNPTLRKKFKAAQENLKKTRGEDKSYPVLAFHGTTAANVRKICKNGFLSPGDQGFIAETDSGFFGAGVYLSGYAGYSIPYAMKSDPPLLILCQVLLGKVYGCESHIHGQSCQPGFDSHISPLGKEFIIFNTSHILPVYIVHCQGQQNEIVATERE